MTNSLLKTICQNSDNLLSEVEELLDKGEDPNGNTKYIDSPLSVASENGRFDVVKLLLSRGANKSQLGWTKIFYAIAYGSIDNLEEVITGNCDLEHRDFGGKTPLLFSILVGDTRKTAMLIEAGADVTAVAYRGKTALAYAIQNDDVKMLNWLVDYGLNPEQRNWCNDTPLIEAAKYGATKCVLALIGKKVDIYAENRIQEQAIAVASNLEIVTALVNAGADINDINKETRAGILGYRIDEAPDISEEEYFKGQNRVFGRVFGKSNPQLAQNPFWQAMVKCGGSAYHGASKINKYRDIYDSPVWSFDRFGKSITLLPDGRFIEIAGEHEDYYDPDFCIYNDVFVHDGRGNCDIYIYPREVFPPTDFHTANLVDKYIYVIGNLGYVEDRRPGYTQVFRLNINTLKMERIETNGEMPGWISQHKSFYDGKSIITIKGGKLSVDKDGKKDYVDNEHEYSLYLKSMEWKKIN